MKARIRDTELYFDVDGSGLMPDGAGLREKPVAFLIHGGPGGDHSDARATCAALTDRLQLVYFDQRGNGRSARHNESRYSLDETVEDLEALRRHLGVGRIVSIGTSYGGMVAMAHAARYPDSVSHLILVVTAAHAGFIAAAGEIVAQRGTPEQIAANEDLWSGRLDTTEKLRRFYEVMGPLYSLKYDANAARATPGRAIFSPEALNAAWAPDGYMRRFDLRPELHAIRAPTLILAGRHDWICPPEFSEEIHRHIPGSQLRIFEQSSHAIRTDESQKFLDAVASFVGCTTQLTSGC
jgi:proline iminopeptidase